MGCADSSSIIANRKHHQSSPNFDFCLKNQRDPDGLPMISIKQIEKELSDSEQLGTPNAVCGLCSEYALLILEVFRIGGKSAYENDLYTDEEKLRKHEKFFQEQIFPKRSKRQVRLYTCYAEASEYDYIPSDILKNYKYTKLPGKVSYFDSECSSVFKFNPESEGTELKPEMMFWMPKYNPEKEEIWVRVWHESVWAGFVDPDKFDPEKVSDELLVWTANELGFKTPPELETRKKLWEFSKKKIMKRYFDRNFDTKK